MEEINVNELKSRIEHKQPFYLIDVREPHEFQEFNIGGELIPLGNIQSELAKGNMSKFEDKEIIVHCRSGQRSRMAQMMMMQAGISNVKNLSGGVLAWQREFGK